MLMTEAELSFVEQMVDFKLMGFVNSRMGKHIIVTYQRLIT